MSYRQIVLLSLLFYIWRFKINEVTKTVNCTNVEMADVYFVYGHANRIRLNAQRRNAEVYPEQTLPHHSIFARIHQSLREGRVLFTADVLEN